MPTPREGYVSLKQWESYMEPFCIFGNVYFVGCKYVSSHIIDTGDGLILLDSSYPQCLYLVTEGMRKLGLDPADIKYILHSHGHYDHLGGTRALIELYGCKTIIGRADRDFANGKVDLTWAKELGFEYFETFEPDILLDDGDTIELGNTKIKAVHTPGHTPGTMSYFFDATDGKDTYRAAMFGGAGTAAMKKDFLARYNLPISCRDDFFNSIEKIKNEKVDIALGNHVGDIINIPGRYKIMKEEGTNPFIDPTVWTRDLEFRKQQLEKLIASGE